MMIVRMPLLRSMLGQIVPLTGAGDKLSLQDDKGNERPDSCNNRLDG
jgi:hypothetical protein